jgi:hypothetical protein
MVERGDLFTITAINTSATVMAISMATVLPTANMLVHPDHQSPSQPSTNRSITPSMKHPRPLSLDRPHHCKPLNKELH